MRVLDTAFAKGFIRVCDDGFNQNWHERNGGNLSYRIKHEEVESVKEELSYDGKWQPIGTSVPCQGSISWCREAAGLCAI